MEVTMWAVWLALSLFLLWQVLVIAFTAVMHAKAVLKRSETVSLFFLVPLVTAAAIGFVLDWAFNWSVGTLIFGELPREWLFTDRCARWKVSAVPSWRADRARWWCEEMNRFDPGHCG